MCSESRARPESLYDLPSSSLYFSLLPLLSFYCPSLLPECRLCLSCRSALAPLFLYSLFIISRSYSLSTLAFYSLSLSLFLFFLWDLYFLTLLNLSTLSSLRTLFPSLSPPLCSVNGQLRKSRKRGGERESERERARVEKKKREHRQSGKRVMTD